MSLKLEQLLSLEACRPRWTVPDTVEAVQFTDVSIDSRTVAAGELYFALKGETHDGHAFVEQALEKGAAAAVVEATFLQENAARLAGKPLVEVTDTLIALQLFARLNRRQHGARVLGLTGTNGKTTTKEMIASVLSQAGSVCKTEGNYNNHIGVPLTLFSLDESHEFAVIEMGTNHFGEIAALCRIAEPDAGLITNIGRGHVEHLQDIHGVARAKMELYDYLKGNGRIFANLDDRMISTYARDYRYSVTYGFDARAQITGKRLPIDDSGCAGLEVQGVSIRLALPGAHNLSNALAAAAVGLDAGLSMQQVKTGLEAVKSPAHRMEVLRRKGVTILNDCYNANPESTLAAMRTLQDMPCSGRKWLVLGDMLELGEAAESAHAEMGHAAPHYGIDALVGYGPLAQNTVAAAEAETGIIAVHIDDKARLRQHLNDEVQKNDIILIKGSRGMKMEDLLSGLLQDQAK